MIQKAKPTRFVFEYLFRLNVLICKNFEGRILLADDAYHGVGTLLDKGGVLSRWGVEVCKIDMSDLDTVSRHIKESTSHEDLTLLWLETPSNPLLKITDLQKVCDMTKEARKSNRSRIATVVDSTWATPCVTQPLTFGADLCMHSATKYIGGHSDALAGAIIAGKW